jgi:hypothetical protein
LAPSAGTISELQGEREWACRLSPDRALETLEEAQGFLAERGLLTLMPDSFLPSLFGACHEEPYLPGRGGFASWPRTKWRWAGRLGRPPQVHSPRLHRGARLYMTHACAALADPICRAELARAEEGARGPLAARLLDHLRESGPSVLEDVALELGHETRALRGVRDRLEKLGALVSEGFVAEAVHRHSSRLQRWDQVFPTPAAGGGLGELVLAGVRAAVIAPEREVTRWFSWPVPSSLIEELVGGGRLSRPEPGWVALPTTSAGSAEETTHKI